MSEKHHKKASEVEHKAPPAAAPILPADGEGKQAPEYLPAPAVDDTYEPRPRRAQE